MSGLETVITREPQVPGGEGTPLADMPVLDDQKFKGKKLGFIYLDAGYGKEPIPLLEDLLAAFPEVRVNIDPKHDAAVDAVTEVIRRTGSLDRVCLGSFSDDRLARLRALLGPGLCTSLGPRAVARLRAGSFGVPAGRIEGACVQVPHRVKGVRLVDDRFVARAHAAGLQVHVWTIDDPAEMHRLLDMGVDGIMTDRPAVLRQVLESRDEWFGA